MSDSLIADIDLLMDMTTKKKEFCDFSILARIDEEIARVIKDLPSQEVNRVYLGVDEWVQFVRAMEVLTEYHEFSSVEELRYQNLRVYCVSELNHLFVG